MERSCRYRSGKFSLIDMLVLIAVLAILVGLLIPYTRDDDGRRYPGIICQNNLRQISTALIKYENLHNQYPGYANVLITTNGRPYVDPDTGKVAPVSFVVPILRLLDRPDLDLAWRAPDGKGPNGGTYNIAPTNPKVRLDFLQCPRDPPMDRMIPVNSYVVNCGMKDGPGSATMPRDWPDNSVFFDQFTGDPRVTGGNPATKMVSMSSAYVAQYDGLQNTLLMSENVDAGVWTDTDESRIGMLWNPRGTIDKSKNPPHLSPPDDNMRINHGTGLFDRPNSAVDPAVFARPSSYHPGGVNVAFCDGHVQFLSDQIDYYVYCLLMSPNGQRVREPGNNKVIPRFDVKVNDAWIER